MCMTEGWAMRKKLLSLLLALVLVCGLGVSCADGVDIKLLTLADVTMTAGEIMASAGNRSAVAALALVDYVADTGKWSTLTNLSTTGSSYIGNMLGALDIYLYMGDGTYLNLYYRPGQDSFMSDYGFTGKKPEDYAIQNVKLVTYVEIPNSDLWSDLGTAAGKLLQ